VPLEAKIVANSEAVMLNHQLKTRQPQRRLLRWLQQQRLLHTVVAAVGCADDDGDAQVPIRCQQQNEVAGPMVPVEIKRGDARDAS